MITKEVTIPYEEKKHCVKLFQEKTPINEIYDYLKANTNSTMSIMTFTRTLHKWRNKVVSDENLEENANLGFKYRQHAATVQINGNGEITQAWLKQKIDDSENFKQLLAEIPKTPKFKGSVNVVVNGQYLLNACLHDMHFGPARFEDYEITQIRILNELEFRSYKECVFMIGSDMFHYDNFKSSTSNGTRLDGQFEPRHWADAKKFWFPIFDKALERSEKVYVKYVKGNHDESMSWAFVQALKERYKNYGSQIEFDDSIDEFKHHVFGRCFLGYAHGDKGKRKDYDRIFFNRFGKEMADCNYKEINVGHLHTYQGIHSNQTKGIYIIGHDTGVPDDDWHKDNGFGGNYKTFQISLFDTERKIGNVFV